MFIAKESCEADDGKKITQNYLKPKGVFAAII